MRLRAGLGLAALLLAALPTVSAQAAQAGFVELTGSRTAWVDVKLPKAVTIDYARTTFNGAGRYVGFYAESLDLPVNQRYQEGATIGAVRLRDFRTPSEPGITEDLAPIVKGGQNRRLDAGRYRFYLLADGAARMRLALSGAPGMTLRPRNQAAATVAARVDILKDMVTADNVQQLGKAGPRAVAFSAIVMGPVKRLYLGGLHACITSTDRCGENGADEGFFPGYVIYPLAEYDFQLSMIYGPGTIRSGINQAMQGATNVTTLEYASAGAFTLSLV